MAKTVKKIKKHLITFLITTILLSGGGLAVSLTSCDGLGSDGKQTEETNKTEETTPATKKCPECGHDITKDQKYCPNCGEDLTKNYITTNDPKFFTSEEMYIFYYDDNALELAEYLPGQAFSGTIERVSKDIDENSVYSKYFSPGKPISFDHVFIGQTPSDITTDKESWEFGFTLNEYPGARLVSYGNPDDDSEFSKLCDCQGYIEIDGKIYRTHFLKFYLNMDYINVKFMMNDGSDEVFYEERIPKEDIIAYGYEGAFAFEKIERYPRRKGFVFEGWYFDPECKKSVNAYTTIQDERWGDIYCYHSQERLIKHTNFYAKWVPNTSGYEPGDIVLSDGTKVAYDSIESITNEQKEKAVAVISYISEDGTIAYGVGLHQSEPLYWCATGVCAYEEFIDIDKNVIRNIKRDDSSGFHSESGFTDSGWDKVYFTGPFDSFAVWDNICQADPEGVEDWNVANNYPSFDYVNKYGTTYSLPEQYKEEWFLPHPFDFIKTSRNYDLVSASYNAVSSIPLREHEFNDENGEVRIGGYWTAMTWLDDYYNRKASYAIPYFFGNYEELDKNFETAKVIWPELTLLDRSWGKCGAGEFVVPFRKFKAGE